MQLNVPDISIYIYIKYIIYIHMHDQNWLWNKSIRLWTGPILCCWPLKQSELRPLGQELIRREPYLDVNLMQGNMFINGFSNCQYENKSVLEPTSHVYNIANEQRRHFIAKACKRHLVGTHPGSRLCINEINLCSQWHRKRWRYLSHAADQLLKDFPQSNLGFPAFFHAWLPESTFTSWWFEGKCS